MLGARLNFKEDIDGSVSLTKDFEELSDIAKADLLRDWIEILQNQYNKAVNEIQKPRPRNYST